MSLGGSLTKAVSTDLPLNLTEVRGGASGPSISLSAPDFGGSTYYEGVDDNDITVTINNATDGASWDLTISSSSGGTPVTASGTVSGSTVNAGAQNLTGLNAGTLTFSYEEGAVEVASRTRTLATTAAPAAPVISITPGASGSAQQTIAWAKPTENGSAITGYTLTVDDGSGFSALATPGAGDTSYVHSNLIIGKEYTYRLTATNGVGTSGNSNEPAETPAGSVHVFLLAGQSNMVGQPTYDGLGEYASNVYDWTDDDYQLATSPLTGAAAGDMGLSITFTEDYLAANPDVDAVALVMKAQNGTGFNGGHWNQGDTVYTNAITEINQATTDYSDHTFIGILWLQGEADDAMSQSAYAAALDQMISDMRSDINGASSTTPFVLGQINDNEPQSTRDAVSDTPNRVPYTDVASSSGLTLIDASHYDAASLRTLGSRYEDSLIVAQSAAVARPDQVTGLAVDSVASGQVTLTWGKPNTNGSDATDYVVQYKLSAASTWSTFPDGTNTNLTATVTGLTNDSAYDFRVACVNAEGTGDYSTPVEGTPTSATPEALGLAALAKSSVSFAYIAPEPSTMTQNFDGTGDAPGNGDSVGQWEDHAAAAYTLAADDTTNEGVYRTANGGYVELSGGNDRLEKAFTDGASDMVFLVVFRSADTTSFVVLSGQSSSYRLVRANPSSAGTAISSGSGSPTYELDGVAWAPADWIAVSTDLADSAWHKLKIDTADLTSWTEFKLGQGATGTGANNHWQADIVAVIGYSKTGLTSGDEDDIEAWADTLLSAATA